MSHVPLSRATSLNPSPHPTDNLCLFISQNTSAKQFCAPVEIGLKSHSLCSLAEQSATFCRVPRVEGLCEVIAGLCSVPFKPSLWSASPQLLRDYFKAPSILTRLWVSLCGDDFHDVVSNNRISSANFTLSFSHADAFCVPWVWYVAQTINEKWSPWCFVLGAAAFNMPTGFTEWSYSYKGLCIRGLFQRGKIQENKVKDAILIW